MSWIEVNHKSKITHLSDGVKFMHQKFVLTKTGKIIRSIDRKQFKRERRKLLRMFHALEFKKFKKIIESNNRFLKVTEENGTTMIRGLYESEVHTIFVNDRLINDSKEALEFIKKNEEYYIINGEKKSLYDLMSIFESFTPNNISRYKGLSKFCSAL